MNMISSSLRNWQQNNSYRIDGDAVYGVYKGSASVGFSVVEEDGGKLFVFMLSGPDSAFDAVEDLLATQRGELHDVQVGDVESYLALFFDESAGEMSDYGMDDLLALVADNFDSCGFSAPNVCVKCGARASKRAFVDNMVQPMCADCREAMKNGGRPARSAAPAPQPQRGRDYDDAAPLRPQRSTYDESYDEYSGFDHKTSALSTSRGYDDYDDRGRSRVPQESGGGNGAVGAILGALAGLVPYLATALIPFELAALCFISGAGAVLGYMFFSGQRDSKRGMTSAVAAAEVISVLSVLIVGALSNVKDSFGATLGNLFSNLPWLNLVMAILGAILGAALLKDKLDKYAKGE